MRPFAAAVVLLLAGALPAMADDLPARKVGLWEVRTSLENRGGAGITVRQCIDAATDQMMMSSAGPLAQSACPKHDVQRSGDTTTIDSTCAFSGKTAVSHAVITGSLDTSYTMTVTTEGEAMPGGSKVTMTVTAKWLGPCTADQKPGDMIFGNGVKLNILEMQKAGPSQGIPLPR
jgi:hypothetical protein